MVADLSTQELAWNRAVQAQSDRCFAQRFQAEGVLKDGLGVVTLRGRDLELSQPVVIKVALADQQVPGVYLRLQHEAEVLAQVQSPWLPSLLHVGREAGTLFLVRPLIPGLTLEQRLQQGQLSYASVLGIARCLVSALVALHERGVLHRDIKPSNLILQNHPTQGTGATLIDFGLARSDYLETSLRDLSVGTIRYMAPEQAGLLQGGVDERSDLYAVGAVLFEGLAGRPAILGHTVTEVLRQHLATSPPDLRALGVEIPRAFNELVQRLLCKDPRERYQTAAGVLHDLDCLAAALAQGDPECPIQLGQGDRRQTLTEPAFVGRQPELTTLVTWAERASQGEGGLVLLEAESGGGKSRLIQEVMQQCRQRGMGVLLGQGRAEEPDRPLLALTGVVADLIGLVSANPATWQRLQHQLADQIEVLVEALPQLRELFGNPDQPTTPEYLASQRSVQALSALLTALATPEQPLLIVVDDAQWADTLTLQVLRSLNALPSSQHYWLLLLAFRTEEVGVTHALRHLQARQHLTLAALTGEEIQALVVSMGGAAMPDAVITLVADLAEGSPFMAAAVLQGLLEQGMLQRQGDRWAFETTETAVQASHRGAVLLSRRLSLLPEATRQLLSVGAVLGKEFDWELAATLAGQSASVARAAIRQAQQRQLVWARAQETRYAFVHDKLRQGVLSLLSPDRQAELHRQAAITLETTAPTQVFDLAYHFEAAGLLDRAAPYALTAAEQARAQRALEVAEHYYRIADRGNLAADPNIRYRVSLGLGEVLMLQGRYEAAGVVFAVARDLATDARRQSQIEGKLGELAFKQGNVQAATAAIERALGLLGEPVYTRPSSFVLPLLREIAVQGLHTLLPRWFVGRAPLAERERVMAAVNLYSPLCHAYWFGRGVIPLLWVNLRQLNLAEQFPPSCELAQVYAEHAVVMTTVPLFERSHTYGKKSLALRRQLGDRWGEAPTLEAHGYALSFASRFTEAIDHAQRAVQIFEKTGDRWKQNFATAQVASSLYRLGQLQAAVDLCRPLYQQAQAIGDAASTAVSLSIWSKASGGNAPAPLLAEELAQPREDVLGRAEVLQANAIARLAQNQPESAITLLVQAITLLRQAKLRNDPVAATLAWLTTARRQQAQQVSVLAPHQRRQCLKTARKTAAEAMKLARFYRNNLPQVLRERALIAAMEDHPQQARRLFHRSLALATQFDMRYEVVLTQQAMAQQAVAWAEPNAQAALASAEAAIAALLPPSTALTDTAAPTLSLVDRFTNVVEIGRKIVTALTPETIFDATLEAAATLLRCDRQGILWRELPQSSQLQVVQGDLAGEIGDRLVQAAIAANQVMISTPDLSTSVEESLILSGVRSALCAPIAMRGQVVGCLYVTHHQVGGLFAAEEQQIAQYLVALTGAALENAEGFAEVQALSQQLQANQVVLRQLNLELQQQVEEKSELNRQLAEYSQRLEEKVLARTQELQEKNQQLEQTLQQLKAAQKQIIAQEKLASLGSLTAGIAHEIRNPLNFVNNFAAISIDLVEELRAEVAAQEAAVSPAPQAVIEQILTDLQENMAEINLQGRRAESIIQSMLLLARQGQRQPQPTELKPLLADAIALACQSIRTKDPTFRVAVKTQTVPTIVEIEVVPQDLNRALINIVENACHAMQAKQKQQATYAPELTVQLLDLDTTVEIHIQDNGQGIPAENLDKIFNPFFTTKPPGEGTGLGLSLAHEIIVGQHQGSITVDSEFGSYTHVAIALPKSLSNPR